MINRTGDRVGSGGTKSESRFSSYSHVSGQGVGLAALTVSH